MGFDIKGTVEQGLDKAQEVINEKAGKEVVTDEHVAKVEEVVTENVSKLTEKFGNYGDSLLWIGALPRLLMG